MLGKLDDSQIEELIKSQAWGRIGCHAEGVTYVVPVNYAYDGANIYAHSDEGMKINMMRKNPEVCFEIDVIENITNWQSVIAWGRFEEITDIDEQQETMQKLINHIVPLIGGSGHPSHGITERESDIGTFINPVVYKIHLRWKTGRFEKR
jgi:nitroimidazol reductase NimA-like FMN-containing flavoprotein (pyridoxamine 5'-phosphate oxidase superfamily)